MRWRSRRGNWRKIFYACKHFDFDIWPPRRQGRRQAHQRQLLDQMGVRPPRQQGRSQVAQHLLLDQIERWDTCNLKLDAWRTRQKSRTTSGPRVSSGGDKRISASSWTKWRSNPRVSRGETQECVPVLLDVVGAGEKALIAASGRSYRLQGRTGICRTFRRSTLVERQFNLSLSSLFLRPARGLGLVVLPSCRKRKLLRAFSR